jgi:hypothetical protein
VGIGTLSLHGSLSVDGALLEMAHSRSMAFSSFVVRSPHLVFLVDAAHSEGLVHSLLRTRSGILMLSAMMARSMGLVRSLTVAWSEGALFPEGHQE